MAKIIKFPGEFHGDPNPDNENRDKETEKPDAKVKFGQALLLQVLTDEFKKHEITRSQLKEYKNRKLEISKLADSEIADKMNNFSEAEFDANAPYYLALYEEYRKRRLFTYEKS